MTDSKSIPEIQKEIVEDFADFFDWEERFEHICELGKKSLGDYPEEHRTEEFKVKGCVSQVWLYPEQKDGRLFFQADSDSIFVKGLVGLVLKVYSGQPPEDILKYPPDFLKEAQLLSNLTPNRANGVASMVKYVKNYAQAMLSK